MSCLCSSLSAAGEHRQIHHLANSLGAVWDFENSKKAKKFLYITPKVKHRSAVLSL